MPSDATVVIAGLIIAVGALGTLRAILGVYATLVRLAVYLALLAGAVMLL